MRKRSLPFAVPLNLEGGFPEDVEGFTSPQRVHAPSPQVRPGSPHDPGLVVFDTVIDKSGTVHCARPLLRRGLSDDFIADALHTLSQWRFEPARIHGEPKFATYLLTVELKHHR